MANHTYTADIISDALFRANEATDASSDFYDQAFVYLNSVYLQICRGGSELAPTINEDWAWLQKATPGVLILEPAITGTCAVAQDSASVTLGAVVADSLVERFLKIEGHPDVFRISTHTGATTAVTLDSVYTGEDNLTATYTVFILEYNLASDVMRLTAPMRCYTPSGRSGMDRTRIQQVPVDDVDIYSAAFGQTGPPLMYAEVGQSTAGTRRIRFDRYLAPLGTHFVRVEYDYLFRPAALTSPGTAEEPIVPREWRHVLADYLLAYLFGLKNDDRAESAAAMARMGLVGMATENRYRKTTASYDLFRIRPRQNGLRRTPWLMHASWGA